MAERDGALQYAKENFNSFSVQRLTELVKIPSVSDWPSHTKEVQRCAEAVKQLVSDAGLENAQFLYPKDKGEAYIAPGIYGEWLKAPGQPTVLLYAHYDVQPPGKEDKWKTPIWDATIVNVPDIGGDRLYGRGTADDKAGVIAHLSAVRAVLTASKALPINVKVLFEGEEEVGSTHLVQILEANKDLLRSDVFILADTGNYDIGVPSITYSLRGIVGLDVQLRTVKASVHSGMWGGPVIDPLVALSKLIGTLHDENGKIVPEGLFEGVRTPSQKELDNIKTLNYTDAKLRKESGLLESVKVAGDPNVAVLNKIWLQPSITIIAMDAPELKGAANKIVDTATARISVRIVANQDPQVVLKNLKAHLSKHVPFGAEVTFPFEEVLAPWYCNTEDDIFRACERALQKGYDHPSVLVGCGGSIGFVEPFINEYKGAHAILVGVEDPYTNAHGENESLLLADFQKSILSLVHLFFELKK